MVGWLWLSDVVKALVFSWRLIRWNLLHNTVYRVRPIGEYSRCNISIEEVIA